MTDKERIKEWAENNLSDVESKINGMFGFNESLYPELIAKRVVLKDLLFLIDSMQEEPASKQKLSNIERTGKDWKEEPVSGDFEMALAEMIDKAQKCVVEPWVVAAQWKDELIKLAKSEEPVSEDLEEAVEIAREEMVEKVTNYLNSKLYDWVQISHFGRREYPDTIMKQDFIYDYIKAMKDE